MENDEPPKNEDPRDAEHLTAFGEARARGDVDGEKRAIAALIGGYLGKAERWLAFRGIEPEHREEIISLWSCRLVKALKENHEFPYPFGLIAMKRIFWAHAEYFRQPYRDRERSSDIPLAEQDGEEGRGEDGVLDHLVLEEALQRLSEKDRQVIETSFLTDLSAAEAGERLGLGEGALRTAKSRALARLRHEFDRQGVTNPG